jgi:hypothetical protein
MLSLLPHAIDVWIRPHFTGRGIGSVSFWSERHHRTAQPAFCSADAAGGIFFRIARNARQRLHRQVHEPFHFLQLRRNRRVPGVARRVVVLPASAIQESGTMLAFSAHARHQGVTMLRR